MARIRVEHDTDAGVAVILEIVPEGTAWRARGTIGRCTECGRKTHHWRADDAIGSAIRHVDGHNR